LLPVAIVPRRARPSLAEVRKRIGKRAPDDIELLAMAMEFKIPLWSNDNDFEDTGITWYPTASLLAFLESR